MAKHFFLPLLCCFTSACYANDLHATKRIQAGSFPRNYFLRTLSSTQPVIWQNSIERLEREMNLLRAGQNGDRQSNTIIANQHIN